MVYYPQDNGLAKSTKKTLEGILRKIVEANITDWDRKLHSAMWAYRTSYKTSIRSPPFMMAFGVEEVMSIEFLLPSLRIQVNEKQLEQALAEGLLQLEEERLNSLRMLEDE